MNVITSSATLFCSKISHQVIDPMGYANRIKIQTGGGLARVSDLPDLKSLFATLHLANSTDCVCLKYPRVLF